MTEIRQSGRTAEGIRQITLDGDPEDLRYEMYQWYESASWPWLPPWSALTTEQKEAWFRFAQKAIGELI